VKPAAFDYVRADTAAEAVAMLAEHGEEARVLAGGQSLMAVLNMRLAQPAVLVDISRASDLGYLRVDGDELVVGAACTQAQVEARGGLAAQVPLLAQLFPHLGHFQTRSRGTVCGSIAHADPSAELPLALLALGGSVLLRSARGERPVGADAFFTGMLATARATDELLVEARFPLAAPGDAQAFQEVAMRHGDYAIVALAAVRDARGLRLAVGGVADRPQVLALDRAAGDSAVADALNEFAWSLNARDDVHASAAYRRSLVRSLGAKLVARVSQGGEGAS
jgi:2-furoyl-CoA dehydrogenase FAD binding subunit